MMRPNFVLERETLKPKNVGVTLARFASYFRKYWYAIVVVAIFMIIGTWVQVTAAEIPGQAVDCYLFQSPASHCTFTTRNSATIDKDSTLDSAAKTQEKIHGLLTLGLTFAGLFVAGSLSGGLMSYAMSWSGQHALWQIRIDVFRHVHRLSLNYYAEHEAGDIMSRFTNDSETIQLVLNFALIQVLTSILLIVW